MRSSCLATKCSCSCDASSAFNGWQRAVRQSTFSHRGTPSGRRRTVACLKATSRSAEITLPRQLAEQFLVVERPAAHNTPYKAALKAFAQSAVLAYECGWNEDGFQQQLEHELQQLPLQKFDMARCRSHLSIVWITIMLMPKRTVVRWTKASPVEDSTMALWRGFVSMICKGYFEKRWAWYPIERLQMELSATTGESTQPAYVSELAGIVYATLFLVAPQFPSI